MSRTVLPLEDTRASSISELKNLTPQEKHVATLEGESSSADGGSNLFWWDPSGDPQNADGVTRVESNIESSGLWRRIVTPSAETTDDLPEGSTNLYHTTEKVRNALSAAGDLSYDSSTGEFAVYTTDVNVKDKFEAGGDLTYHKNPISGYDLANATEIATLDITSQDGQVPRGIAFNGDGTKLFMCGDEDNNIYEYNLTSGFDLSTASYSGTSFDVGSETTLPSGVTFNDNGTKMFVSDAENSFIFEYDVTASFDISTASYSGTSFDTGITDTAPTGVEFNSGGTKMFVSMTQKYVSGNQKDGIYEYELTTGFDVSTASFNANFNVTGADGLAFNTDGTKMFVATGDILEYNLGTSFDVSTASFSGTDLDSSDTSPQDVAFNPSGTRMYIPGSQDDAIDEYDTKGRARYSINVSEVSDLLSSSTTDDLVEGSNLYYTSDRVRNEFEVGPNLSYSKFGGFDISTATYSGTSLGIGSEETFAKDVKFSGDGTKMFVTGRDTDSIFEYNLTTSFDISTASYSGTSFDVSSEEGPQSFTFNSGGTKMFVIGSSNDSVHEYSLSAGFDLSTASYSGTSFDLSSEASSPMGIAFSGDGLKMFVTGNSAQSIFEYSLTTGFDVSTASYTGTSLDVSSEDTDVKGIAFSNDGESMFIVGEAGANIFEYSLNTSFDLSTGSYSGTSFDVSSEDGDNPKDVTFSEDGTKMFVIKSSSNIIHDYNTVDTSSKAQLSADISGIADSTTDDLDEGNTNLYYTNSRARNALSASGDLTYDSNTGDFSITTTDFSNKTTNDLSEGSDNLYYTSDRAKSEFEAGDGLTYEKYPVGSGYDLAAASYTNTSFDISGEDSNAREIAFSSDGTKMFIAGYNSESVIEYDLSTEFDISTGSYSGTSFSVSSEESSINGVTFSSDGTKMFTVGLDTDNVYEYDLSTGFDVSTASYSGTSFNVGSEATYLNGIQFNGDGTKMFLSGDSVYEYDLTAAFDLSTASYSGTSLDLTSEDSSPEGIEFNNDGTEMFFIGGGNYNVYKYDLTTGFDLSTASYSGTSFYVGDENAAITGLAFGSDGTKMFTVASAGDGVYEYDTGSISDKAQFSADISGIDNSTTDDLSEGSNNLYFTEERVDDRVDSLIVPGSNLTQTYNDGSDSFILDVADNLSEYSNDAGFITDLSGFTTDDLSEGSNSLYYESSRVKNEFEAAGDLSYTKTPVNGYELSNASSTNTTFDIESQTTFPQGITFNEDGTEMFLAEADTGNVYEYNLSTAFDLSAASYTGTSFDVSSEDGSPKGIAFNPGGTKMIIPGEDSNAIYEYNLSTAFDLSTASYSGTSFDISSEDSDPNDIVFNSDGTKMFFIGEDTEAIFEYNLNTGFDISTASYSGTSFDISSEEPNGKGIAFNNDGSEMYLVGTDTISVHGYNLNTGFDISTATYSGTSFDVSGEDSIPHEVAFNNNGIKMFVVGNLGNNIHEYKTGNVSDKAQFSVEVPEISVDDSGSGVLSDLNSLDFGKALTASDDGSGAATVDLDAGFSSATFSGDGSVTQFQIPHGLSSEPSSWIVQPATDDGSDISHVTADGTNLTVNYASAPPSGTDNIELNWIAIQ